jgi:hypothetical protein
MCHKPLAAPLAESTLEYAGAPPVSFLMPPVFLSPLRGFTRVGLALGLFAKTAVGKIALADAGEMESKRCSR